jgi:hypothetical protein
VERRVEYRDHGHILAHDLLARPDANQVGRVVQRRKRHAVLNRLDHRLRNQHRIREEFTAVYHTVPDRVDLLHGRNDALLRVEQDVDNRRNRFRMGRHRRFDRRLVLAARMHQHTINPNALAQALCHNLPVDCVNQLVFQR